MRLHSVTSTIENGFLYLPEKAEWLAEYLHEMTSFLKGKFDDQCDSTSQALDWIKSGYSFEGYMKWLELGAAKTMSGTTGGNNSEACPRCKSDSISNIGPQKRCLNCGNQWGKANQPFRFPTKRDMGFGRG